MQTNTRLLSPLQVILRSITSASKLHPQATAAAAAAAAAAATAMGLTTDELRSFHHIDRKLYTRIVKNLLRDAIDCLQVMAFWFWLEQIGYSDIISKMVTLPDTVVNAVIDEAILCLNNLEKDPLLQTFIDHNNMPVSERLMNQPISFQFIYKNKGLAVTGITKMVHDVCLRTFDDIAQEALAAKAAAEEEEQMVGAHENVQDDLRTFDDIIQDDHQQYLNVMGAPHHPVPWFDELFRPMFQTPVMVVPAAHQPQPMFYGLHPHQHLLEQSEAAAAKAAAAAALSAGTTSLNPQAQPWSPNQDAVIVSPDDRTMFVTFSRGYPMTEHEVLEFFTRSYGDCMESMHMEEVPGAYRHPLYARLVFYNASSIAAILDGKEKQKFVINGKHVWVRQYVAKQGKAACRLEQELDRAGGDACSRTRKLMKAF